METVALALLSLFAFKYPTFTTLGLWGGVGLGVLTQIIKRTTDIPRPASVLPHDMFQIIGDPLLANAFPSGHSVTALLFTACLIFYFRPRAWIALLILAAGLMAAFSRIAVGAHWPLDVLARRDPWLDRWLSTDALLRPSGFGEMGAHCCPQCYIASHFQRSSLPIPICLKSR